MTTYLLDANVVSHVVRFPDSAISRRIESLTENELCTSVIVAAELRYGCEKRQSAKLTRQVERVLSSMRIMPFGDPSDRRYAEIRATLERTGKTIGNNDMLIAAHALALGCVLVTDNVREFSRVPGLTVENWLR